MRPVPRRCRPDSELIPRVSERDGPCRRSRRFAMLSDANEIAFDIDPLGTILLNEDGPCDGACEIAVEFQPGR
jgi:hypothetical protein